jgi:hypothetical protein
VNGFIQKIYVDEGKRSERTNSFKLEMLNQDFGFKAMVQAAEEVNRLKPCDRNISDVMETAKAKLAPKRLWKHCRKHRLRNYIFPVNGD